APWISWQRRRLALGPWPLAFGFWLEPRRAVPFTLSARESIVGLGKLEAKSQELVHVLRNRSREHVCPWARTRPYAVAQIRLGAHARAAEGHASSRAGVSERSDRRNQWKGFDGGDAGLHPAGVWLEDGALYLAPSSAAQRAYPRKRNRNQRR